MNLVEIKNLGKIYHTINSEIIALKDISFDIEKNKFIAIVGPSGCGKSTILKILCGLEDKSYGKINKEKNLKFGFMFQQDTLFEWLTIMDNCLLGAKINKCLNNDTINHCINLLKAYGLYEFKDNYPNELSGGMRQRVALIRTLILNPDVLLLDEPFSALDYQNRLKISNDVYEILKKENKTTVMVTHDVSEAVSMADTIIVLSNRPAEIVNIYKIDYDKESPIKNRLKKEFNEYCNKIWGDLNVI
ncbi:MAG: ABC transporter ATP-binding protein [Bacilli bacterium]|nr:ABC transporter ATP-binding protein [Bacilli bacterium]